ncbi:MAG: hypothetical protein ACOCW2_04060 [Chitinivibrionales bacterium]
MPECVLPTSDTARLAFLQTAEAAIISDYNLQNYYVSGETKEKVHDILPVFGKAVVDSGKTKSKKGKENSERNQALNELITFTRDSIEVIRRQVKRVGLPAQVFTMYGLTLDGSTPKPTVNAEWMIIARKIVEGAKYVAAKGHPVFACPTPDEVEVKLNIAEKEHGEVAEADREHDEAEAEIGRLREKAEGIIRDIMDELRFNLRKLDEPSQRRIQRTYGAQFRYLTGEPVDDGDDQPILPSDNQPISAS